MYQYETKKKITLLINTNSEPRKMKYVKNQQDYIVPTKIKCDYSVKKL